MSQVAGADAWVNGPYMSDTHALWADIEAAAPVPVRRKKPEFGTTPRRRAMTDRSTSSGGTATPQRATGDTSSPPSENESDIKAPKVRPKLWERSPQKSTAPPMYSNGEEKKVVKREKKAKTTRVATDRGGKGKEVQQQEEAPAAPPVPRGDKSAASSTSVLFAERPKSRSPSPKSRLVQPRWDRTNPPRRAPGEVINKYNHQGLMEETFQALHDGPDELGTQMTNFDGSGNSSAGFSTVSTGTQGEGGNGKYINRVTTSPSTRCHPNQERRNELRDADMFTNINYFATSRIANKTSNTGDAVYGAPDNDRRMKESSWISSQAWFESLRYYPKGAEAVQNDDCEATYSGNTHGSKVPAEHLENDVRNRVGIAAADPGWMPSQLQEPWAPDLDKRMHALRVKKK